MNINEQCVMSVADYHKVDGRLAPDSATRALTLGLKTSEETALKEMIAQIWQRNSANQVQASTELPLYQVLDLAILTFQSLVYFQDAYRFPLLYNPENPTVERIGLQGDAMTVGICTDNPGIDKDIADFSQELSDQGELLGERVRTLARLLKELGY